MIAALEIKKVPPVPLSLSASSASLASASAALGETLDTHVYPLVDSLHTQSRALVLAASNLSLHLGSLASFHTSLGPLAAREFARQRELLASYRAALWVVERIAVDRRLFSGKTKDGERKLGDYVNLKKMAVVEEGCVKLEGSSDAGAPRPDPVADPIGPLQKNCRTSGPRPRRRSRSFSRARSRSAP